MYPIQDKWLQIYSRDPQRARTSSLDRLCAVNTADGRHYVKIRWCGSQPARYNLGRWSAPPIENEEVERAVPIDAIVPY